MKILHLVESFYPGSINKRLQKVKLYTEPLGLEHYFMAQQDRQILGQSQVIFGDVVHSTAELERVLQRIQPDLIDIHDIIADADVNLCTHYAKTVCSIHFAPAPTAGYEEKFVEFQTKRFNINNPLYFSKFIEDHQDSFRFFICFSESVRETLTGMGVDRKRIVKHPPFLLQPERQTTATKPIIAYVGRLHPEKGIHLLLDSLDQLQVPNWELWIAGTGDLTFTRALMQTVREKGKQDQVRFLGYLSGEALEELYTSSKVFVFPSLTDEGLGYSPMEALMYGLPIVSFAVRGSEEWLRDGYNGFAVAKNDLRGLMLALDRVLRDEQLYQSLKENTREWQAKFALDEQIRQVVALYTQIHESVV